MDNLTSLATYLTKYTSDDLHLHFDHKTEGFSFAMGILAMVLGLPESWVYSGTVDPDADWMPFYGTTFEDILTKIENVSKLDRTLMLVVEPASMLNQLNDMEANGDPKFDKS